MRLQVAYIAHVADDEERLWLEVRELLEYQLESDVDPAAEFTRVMGIHPDEAAVSELEWAREHLQARQWDVPLRYSFRWDEDASDGWVTVASGPGLSQPVDVRVGMKRGRPCIVGIRVDNGTELTADHLREPKLKEILSAFLGRWTADGPDVAGIKFKYHQDLHEWWVGMRSFLDASPAVEGEVPRAQRGRAPTDEMLRDFARHYVAEMQTAPHGAISRAARAVHTGRTTAYRWLELCRERGWIPDEIGEKR